jgi:enoyl-CoA hydratase/carnithine racemase
MNEYIKWKNLKGIGVLTLNRPEQHNALSYEMIGSIADRLEACLEDKTVNVIVLRGAGNSFCSGGDLKGHPFLSADNDEQRQEYLLTNHRIAFAVRHLPQPVIGELHGLVGGAGLDLAMACDIRIASENARLGVLFTRVGLMPDMGGTYWLPRLVGTSKALELLFTGDLIDGSEAHRIGLVNQVVAESDLETEVMAFAQRLIKGPLQSYRFHKKAVYHGIDSQMEAIFNLETNGQCELMKTQDVKEALEAFQQNRHPVFKGR